MSAMPIVPRMKAKGDDTPAWVPMSAEMKITPMVGEMKASDMAMALGRPREFRFNSLLWAPGASLMLLMLSPSYWRSVPAGAGNVGRNRQNPTKDRAGANAKK